jgi:hypothetical protein
VQLALCLSKEEPLISPDSRNEEGAGYQYFSKNMHLSIVIFKKGESVLTSTMHLQVALSENSGSTSLYFFCELDEKKKQGGVFYGGNTALYFLFGDC